MVKITFVKPNGSEKVIEGSDGSSVMEAALANGLNGIVADCGGACSCATCHVYVDDDWLERIGPPDDVEREMLEMAIGRQANSRLSCQISLAGDLDGLRVTIPASQF